MTAMQFRKGMVISIMLLFVSTSALSAVGAIKSIEEVNIDKYLTSTKTITVDNEGDGDYIHIQDAINNATAGDTINVYSGVYNEKVSINVNDIIIEGKDFELGIGSDNGMPIIDADYYGDVVYIPANKIKISGFMLQNSGIGSDDSGIKIQSKYNTITGNRIISNNNGIYIHGTSDNNIYDNSVLNNTDGIYLYDSSDNNIYDNSVLNNHNGIYLNYLSIVNDIHDNTIASNSNDGIACFTSNSNSIGVNIISNNSYGIAFSSSSSNSITGNIISGNTFAGIKLDSSAYNTIADNSILDNNDGISFFHTSKNTVTDNNILNNHRTGININSSTDDTIDGNVINTKKFGASILIYNSHNTFILNNDISTAGISLYYASDNHVSDNSISNSLSGIYLNYSSFNIITGNTISSINFDSVYLGCFSNDNKLHSNCFINNQLNAYDAGDNTWDDGYPSGGNYWSNFDEPSEGAYDQYSGPNQDVTHSDGIVDTPYYIPGGSNQDRYPLMYLWGPPNKPSRPTGPAVGRTGREYTYSTSSVDPNDHRIQYGWDWDGDKVVDEWTKLYDSGKTVSASHSWDHGNSYELCVKAMDEYGTESDWSDPLAISIPKNRLPDNMSFLQFFRKSIDRFLQLEQMFHSFCSIKEGI